MSLSWGVIPLDPESSELLGWLRDHGIEPPPTPGRAPTLAELRAALEACGVHPVCHHQLGEALWSMSVGEPGAAEYASLTGTVELDGRLTFHFHGSSCQETTMLAILRGLAHTCGPQIWYDAPTATPILVTGGPDDAAHPDRR